MRIFKVSSSLRVFSHVSLFSLYCLALGEPLPILWFCFLEAGISADLGGEQDERQNHVTWEPDGDVIALWGSFL